MANPKGKEVFHYPSIRRDETTFSAVVSGCDVMAKLDLNQRF